MKKLLILLLLFDLLAGAEGTLLFYCGATMVQPMRMIARIYRDRYHRSVQILQGGSGDLYRRLTTLKRGDLYLPGSRQYLQKGEGDDLFPYRKVIGVNRLVILVAEGNPLGVHTLDDLLRPGIRLAIGAADLGSIGRITREVLTRYGGKNFYRKIQNNAMYFVTDSRELARLIEKGIVDAGISWKATAYFPDDRDRIDAVDLPEALSSPRLLELATLRYSRDPEGAKEFVDLAASPQGRKIMTEYGFR